MAGQNESQAETTKEKLAKFEEVLNEYTKKIGINKIPYNPVEIQTILELDYDKIMKLSEDECGAHSFILSKFAAYVNQEQNRQKVRVNWAKTNLNSLLAKEGNKYGDSFVKYEIKIAGLCNENSEARILSQIVNHAEARSIELEDMASYMNTISRSLNDNRQTKRKFHSNRES